MVREGHHMTASVPPEAMEDRFPAVLIESILKTIASRRADLGDEDGVWEAYLTTKRPEDREYLRTIRRAGRQVFTNTQQELYDFGVETCGAGREEFCRACGETFIRMYFRENLQATLEVALSSREAFQTTIVGLMRYYLRRYAGGRYVLSESVTPEEIRVMLEPADVESVRTYFGLHGLSIAQAFRNSLAFIAGAFGAFLARVVADWSAEGIRTTVEGTRGVMVVPVPADARFAYESLTRELLGYTDELIKRQRSQILDERLEQGIIVGSEAMRDAWRRIIRAGRSEETLLLRGESGTGKSFLARKIHELSGRAEGPFVEVALTSDVGTDNMIQSDLFGHVRGAFTGATEHKRGLFSIAEGGTIFLDEVGDASPEVQAKLLRVIETKTFKELGGTRDLSVDVRIIAATNRDLESMVGEGRFRQDLYYRLCVIPVELPPLRARPADVPLLAEFLLARGGMQKRMGEGVAEALVRHDWPGNVRELDHALRYAAAMSDGPVIAIDDLPSHIAAAVAAPVAARPVSRSRDAVACAGPVIDEEALARAIRRSPALPPADAPTYSLPSHVDYAKRTYLRALIRESGGDLAFAARHWDRSSENTIRKAIREYGLAGELAAAREAGSAQAPPSSA
jgi:transcriptional regulator with GAF, ATPase, and Fis domain